MVDQRFELVMFDTSVYYDRCDCVVARKPTALTDRWVSEGRKVIIDRLSETAIYYPGALILTNDRWFWYDESLSTKYFGRERHTINTHWTHRAFMPMWMPRSHRQYLLDVMGERVHELIWSAVWKGRYLPNDADNNHSQAASRHFNPEWYDATPFSFVIESTMDQNLMENGGTPYPFFTEKICKPFGFRHPFVIAGVQGILKWIRDLGFVTWDNLFDESYDDIPDWKDRCDQLVRIVFDTKIDGLDQLTLEKLQHNHDRYYDSREVINRFNAEILDTIDNHVQT